MRTREATPADFDRVAALTLDAYRALPQPVTAAYERRLADVAARLTDGATVLVAEDATGGIVGTVTLVLEDGEFFQHDYGRDGDAGFRMLAVDPDHRGGGIAYVRDLTPAADGEGRDVGAGEPDHRDHGGGATADAEIRRCC